MEKSAFTPLWLLQAPLSKTNRRKELRAWNPYRESHHEPYNTGKSNPSSSLSFTYKREMHLPAADPYSFYFTSLAFRVDASHMEKSPCIFCRSDYAEAAKVFSNRLWQALLYLVITVLLGRLEQNTLAYHHWSFNQSCWAFDLQQPSVRAPTYPQLWPLSGLIFLSKKNKPT